MSAPRSALPPSPHPLATACGLALAAAVSLGLARFSYALLLPPMRADLGWSYFVGGAMNTANAVGYLLGALAAPRWLARHDARRLLLGGGWASALLLAAHGAAPGDGTLLALRLATGVASAASFIAGGLLAARLAGNAAAGRGGGPAGRGLRRQPSAGLLLGLYYGGTGAGIVASALLVPPLAGAGAPHGWRWAWVALGAAALAATAITAALTRTLAAPPAAHGLAGRTPWRPLAFGLAGYLMFGLGYIGYMTFSVTLLREQGLRTAQATGFYVVLGIGVMLSSWLWSRLLQRARGGGALALLTALLALATLLPVWPGLAGSAAATFASGALFGAVFLSVVASTTALVRHNLPAAAWPGGIAAFTVAFAAGQIVGPSLVGWVADRAGGLAGGFAFSAAVLAVGALLAWRQRPLGLGPAQTHPAHGRTR